MRLVLIVLVGLTAAGVARAAEGPIAQLSYTRGPGADSCPDETALRDAVAARLGYDPFRPEAATTVSAVIMRDGHGLRAEIKVQDQAGEVTGSRSIASGQNDCGQLASAMALAISIAIDPMALTRAPPGGEAPLPPAACPAVPDCPKPPEAPPERVRFWVGAGGLGALGSGPAPALGFEVGVGLRYMAASLSLEGRFDVPFAVSATTPGSVQSSLILGMLVPCAHWRWLAGCAIVAAGGMRGEGLDVSAPATHVTPYAAAGWRIAAEAHLYRALWLRVHLDGLATLVRTTLTLNGVDTFTTPPLSGALGVGMLASFP